MLTMALWFIGVQRSGIVTVLVSVNTLICIRTEMLII